ncbi:MAG: MFS transporter [Ruminococcaceae bacterium]|nr:MFS transporter [Oscillospiraceae bacterium]
MSENLRINQYSQADICNMIISATHPADLDDICKEAFEYVEAKIHSYQKDPSQIIHFGNYDVDICEKLIIFGFHQFDTICYLYSIFDALRYRGYSGAYGTLAQAAIKGTVTDEMSAYTAILYAAFIKQEENLDKICAGLSNKHKELYKKYFYAIFDYYKLIANRLNISEENENEPDHVASLRIDKYSAVEIYEMIMNKSLPSDWEEIADEAHAYLREKYSKRSSSPYINAFDHHDMDIAEAILATHPYNFIEVIILNTIFTDQKGNTYNGLYGSMGQAIASGRIDKVTSFYSSLVNTALNNIDKIFFEIKNTLGDDAEKVADCFKNVQEYYKTVEARVSSKSADMPIKNDTGSAYMYKADFYDYSVFDISRIVKNNDIKTAEILYENAPVLTDHSDIKQALLLYSLFPKHEDLHDSASKLIPDKVRNMSASDQVDTLEKILLITDIYGNYMNVVNLYTVLYNSGAVNEDGSACKPVGTLGHSCSKLRESDTEERAACEEYIKHILYVLTYIDRHFSVHSGKITTPPDAMISMLKNYYESLLGILSGYKVFKPVSTAAVVTKPKPDVISLEPEEESMLKNMDIFKARDLSKGSLSNKMKDIYTKGLINLASTASDDGVAVTLYEKAAWLDNSTHKYTDKIVSGLHSRIEKAGCLENQNKIPLGALGDELRKIRDVFWSAPDESTGFGTRMKYLFFAFLCLALTGGLFLLSTSSIISDPTLMMFIPVIVTVVVSVIIGIIYLGFFVGLFIGFIVGSIAGVLFTYAFALVPVAAIIAALVFIIKAFRSDSSNRKKYHEHFERHNIKGKISDYLEVVACTKAPFYNMARSNELDDIRNYYLIAEKVIDVYKNI